MKHHIQINLRHTFPGFRPRYNLSTEMLNALKPQLVKQSGKTTILMAKEASAYHLRINEMPCNQTLSTHRLLLRPYTADDAPEACRLAGDVLIADTTMAIPHPYSQEAAAGWIATHAKGFEQKTEMIFAIETKTDHQLTGTVSLLNISSTHATAELGYWISVENWGKGFCTEAVSRLIKFASEELGITRFTALCFARNPASARVMEKAGMKREGYLVQHIFKNGCYEDLLLYGLVLPGRQESGLPLIT